jgi:hypothetical protein
VLCARFVAQGNVYAGVGAHRLFGACSARDVKARTAPQFAILAADRDFVLGLGVVARRGRLGRPGRRWRDALRCLRARRRAARRGSR